MYKVWEQVGRFQKVRVRHQTMLVFYKTMKPRFGFCFFNIDLTMSKPTQRHQRNTENMEIKIYTEVQNQDKLNLDGNFVHHDPCVCPVVFHCVDVVLVPTTSHSYQRQNVNSLCSDEKFMMIQANEFLTWNESKSKVSSWKCWQGSLKTEKWMTFGHKKQNVLNVLETTFGRYWDDQTNIC